MGHFLALLGLKPGHNVAGVRWLRFNDADPLPFPPCVVLACINLQVACGDKCGNIRVYDLAEMELAHTQVRKEPLP